MKEKNYLMRLAEGANEDTISTLRDLSETETIRIYDWVKSLENGTNEKYLVERVRKINENSFSVKVTVTVTFSA